MTADLLRDGFREIVVDLSEDLRVRLVNDGIVAVVKLKLVERQRTCVRQENARLTEIASITCCFSYSESEFKKSSAWL